MGMRGQIALTGYLELTQQRKPRVLAALPRHIDLTRAEAGCLKFEIALDPDHPDRLRVDELFSSRAAFDAHQKRVAQSEWGELTEGLKRVYEIREIHASV